MVFKICWLFFRTVPVCFDPAITTRRKERRLRKGRDNDLCVVDRSGAARAPLSIHRWNEAGPAARGADRAVTAAGPVRAVPRYRRGARRDRPDPPGLLGIRPVLTPL